ncbi:hypothetical protein N9Y19_01785 [Porticoccaceae bacterium]|jgi:hypothetical protein|nr:hypothetical protein [Porticoccaceae bacterium]
MDPASGGCALNVIIVVVFSILIMVLPAVIALNQPMSARMVQEVTI